MLKRILMATMLLAIGAAMVGCEASASVDPNGTGVRSSDGTYEKKTTTVTEPNGDTHTKTEVHSNNP